MRFLVCCTGLKQGKCKAPIVAVKNSDAEVLASKRVLAAEEWGGDGCGPWLVQFGVPWEPAELLDQAMHVEHPSTKSRPASETTRRFGF